jgi:hypothetical protein
MKIKLFVLWIGCLFCNVSVGAQSIYKQNSIKYPGISEDKTYHLRSKKNNPACRLKIDFFYPDMFPDAVILEKVQAVFIGRFFGQEYESLPPDKAMKSYITNYIFEYKNEFEHNDFYQSEWQESPDLYTFEKAMRNTILFNKGNVISQVINTYEYEGGVHSNSETQGMVIDLTTGQILAYEDVLTEESKEDISELLLAALLKTGTYENREALIEAGFDFEDIPVTNNFVADEKGITFIYNRYELGPSYLGIREITLPYSDIVFYMKEDCTLYRWAKNFIPGNWVKYETLMLKKEYHPYHYYGFTGFTADIQFTFPSAIMHDSGLFPAIQRQFIKNAFGENYADLSPENAIESFYQDTLDAYRSYMNTPHAMTYIAELIAGVAEERKGMLLMSFSKDFVQRNVFHYNSHGLISYTVKTNRYNGGTYGFQTENAFNIDITSGKPILLKDVFSDEAEIEINNLIYKCLLKENACISIDDLKEKGYNTEKITANNNFFFNTNGITFVFQPDEIISLSSGIQMVQIPYEEIVGLMREEWVKRLNINHIKS